MKKINILLVLILTFVFISCRNNEIKKEKINLSKEWTLVLLNDEKIIGNITLLFDEKNKKITGSGGINRYFGSVYIDKNKVEVGILGTTFMAGEENLMNQESTYLEILSNISSYEIIEGKLLLKSKEQKLLFK